MQNRPCSLHSRRTTFDYNGPASPCCCSVNACEPPVSMKNLSHSHEIICIGRYAGSRLSASASILSSLHVQGCVKHPFRSTGQSVSSRATDGAYAKMASDTGLGSIKKLERDTIQARGLHGRACGPDQDMRSFAGSSHLSPSAHEPAHRSRDRSSTPA
jgi:hypothetical protein